MGRQSEVMWILNSHLDCIKLLNHTKDIKLDLDIAVGLHKDSKMNNGTFEGFPIACSGSH